MYILDKFTTDYLQVFDKEGNSVGVNDNITISFEMELDTRRSPRTGIKKLEKDENKMGIVKWLSINRRTMEMVHRILLSKRGSNCFSY